MFSLNSTFRCNIEDCIIIRRRQPSNDIEGLCDPNQVQDMGDSKGRGAGRVDDRVLILAKWVMTCFPLQPTRCSGLLKPKLIVAHPCLSSLQETYFENHNFNGWQKVPPVRSTSLFSIGQIYFRLAVVNVLIKLPCTISLSAVPMFHEQ